MARGRARRWARPARAAGRSPSLKSRAAAGSLPEDRIRRAPRALNCWLISTVRHVPAPHSARRSPAAEPSTCLGKRSASAAADDRFAQLDVVGLTIALATKRSPGPSARRLPSARVRPAAGAGVAVGRCPHRTKTKRVAGSRTVSAASASVPRDRSRGVQRDRVDLGRLRRGGQRPGLPRPSGRRNGELPARRSRGSEWDLAVARDRRSEIAAGGAPDHVVRALAKHLAAVFAQVSFELAPLQAARLIVSDSTWPPPIGGSRPSSR
jgi:hypothetical protein